MMTHLKTHSDDDPYRGLRYICLARQSDDSQGATSTQAQVKFMREEAEKRGMVYVDAVVLEGVTGSMPGRRKDLEDLLERKRTANDFDVLVVQLIDRLTRGGALHGFWFEYECNRTGIILLYAGEEMPEGSFANLIKVAKYEAAQEHARLISQRSVQGSVFALGEHRISCVSQTPFGCWRLYCNAEGEPQFYIRNVGDGRQQKLDAETHQVIDTYGSIGGGSKGHYRKQKSERVYIAPGDEDKIATVIEMMQMRWVRGIGGLRIAAILNERGILSPKGKPWSQNQVDSICSNPIYFGWALGNRRSKAIYYEQGTDGPQSVHVDPRILAKNKHMPNRLRPPSEWLWAEEPYMLEYLPKDIREYAFNKVKQRALVEWQRKQDPTRPKRSKNKHKESEYILTGLLVCKQDGEKMSGTRTGRKGKEKRQYRHLKGKRDYKKGSIFNRMIQAEPLEDAILKLIHQMLGDRSSLREKLLEVIEATAPSQSVEQDLNKLRQRRQKLADKFQRLIRLLTDEDHADAAPELERLRAERRELDQRIADLEHSMRRQDEDPDELADKVLERLQRNRKIFSETSPSTMRRLLEAFVERVEVDLETRDAEVWLKLPPWIALEGDKSDCLVPSSGFLTGYETNISPIQLGYATCRYERILKPGAVCYHCRRASAAA